MLRWCTHDDHGRSLVSKLDGNGKWPQASDVKESCSAMHVVDVLRRPAGCRHQNIALRIGAIEFLLIDRVLWVMGKTCV